MTEERREGWNKRQIDSIEDKVAQILTIINGNGHIGMAAKVEVMWNTRALFIGTIIANIGTIIFFVINKGGG